MSRPRLAPEANRILFIKNLSYNIDTPALFDLFGKFGPIRQIRAGTSNATKGTAFVVYEDVVDAKQACDKLNGFNFMNRYLVVLYHQPEKMKEKSIDVEERREELERIKRENNIEIERGSKLRTKTIPPSQCQPLLASYNAAGDDDGDGGKVQKRKFEQGLGSFEERKRFGELYNNLDDDQDAGFTIGASRSTTWIPGVFRRHV